MSATSLCRWPSFTYADFIQFYYCERPYKQLRRLDASLSLFRIHNTTKQERQGLGFSQDSRTAFPRNPTPFSIGIFHPVYVLQIEYNCLLCFQLLYNVFLCHILISHYVYYIYYVIICYKYFPYTLLDFVTTPTMCYLALTIFQKQASEARKNCILMVAKSKYNKRHLLFYLPPFFLATIWRFFLVFVLWIRRYRT